jgi:hypothetical protein
MAHRLPRGVINATPQTASQKGWVAQKLDQVSD